MVSPAEMAARTVASGAVRVDAFEALLFYAGLDNIGDLPPRGSPLTPDEAARLLAALLKKPVTLANFPPRMGASHLLREVLEGGEVSREELLRRVERFSQVAVLRPDGYLAWVINGRTLQKVAPVEWQDGAFRARGFELGRFYTGQGGAFRLADAQMQQAGPLLAEVYDDADYLSRTLDGAEEAFFELALAMGKLLTYPSDSLAALQHLPAGLAALIASSPEYLERFRYMTRGEQVKALSKLATTLIVTCGAAGGTTRTLTAALGGAEATVPVLSLTAEGALVMERITVPVGAVATAVGTGVGGVYVLSTASGGDGPRANESHAGGEAAKDASTFGPKWRPRPVTDPACQTGCEAAARQIQKHIGGDIKRIVPADPAASNLGGYRGHNPGWAHHEVVVKNGRVYDAFTGYKGATINEYKSLWQYPDAINFTF